MSYMEKIRQYPMYIPLEKYIYDYDSQRVKVVYIKYFFLSGFSFTNIHDA